MEALKGKVAELEAAVETLKARVAELESLVETLRAEIEVLKAEVGGGASFLQYPIA